VNEARRRAYLEALGFDVWVARSAALAGGAQAAASADTPFDATLSAPFDASADQQNGRIRVASGRGSTLLVCSSAADSASKFAADVVRALGGDPAWAWPIRDLGRDLGRGVGRDAGGDHLTLEAAIGARLITRVLVFGDDTARWLFQGAIPPVIGSATVTPLAGLGEIAQHAAAKRALWRCLQDPLLDASPGSAGPSAA
jgi:hypothetical protein